MNKLWSRPVLDATAPNRGFTGIYRTAEVVVKGTTLGGIPLQSATDAVVATVQLGYKVADKQIDRARRLAKELQGATARAGIEGPEALDATERLLMRALLTGIDWVEGAAASPTHPMRRMLAAEYRMLGSLFGLTGEERSTSAAPAASPGRDTDAPAGQRRAPRTRRLAVRHDKSSARRMVSVLDCTLPAIDGPVAFTDLIFYAADATGTPPMLADLVLGEKEDVLLVKTKAEQPSGRWLAAICDANDVQIGHVEIEL